MPRMTGGQAAVLALLSEGVTDIFGIPGVQLDGFTDALHAHQDRVALTVVRNEQAATYMADGYSRSSGRPGVAMVVPGPGVLNAGAGLATAWATSSRVLLLAGQIPSGVIGLERGALHEIQDQSGILGGLTKWSAVARDPRDVPAILHEAFRQLRSGRPRPVAVELPADVLLAEADIEIGEPSEPEPCVPAPASVDALAAMLGSAQRPVFYVGGGALAARAGAALRRVASRLGAPIVTSENGKGAAGGYERAYESFALAWLREHSDLVVGVGTRFVDVHTRQISTAGARLALINADERDLRGPRHPDLAVLGDARLTLEALDAVLDASGEPARDAWAPILPDVDARVAHSLATIAPQREILDVLRASLPDDGVLVSELTQVGYAANLAFRAGREGTYLWPGFQGTLGYGFATALGVQAADRDRAVISITGDGGFSWTLQELSTAKRYELPLVTVVFEDGHFGNVRRIQLNQFDGRVIGSDLTNPDYLKLADAFGIVGYDVTSPEELGVAVRDALAQRKPALIRMRVGEFPSPWPVLHSF